MCDKCEHMATKTIKQFQSLKFEYKLHLVCVCWVLLGNLDEFAQKLFAQASVVQIFGFQWHAIPNLDPLKSNYENFDDSFTFEWNKEYGQVKQIDIPVNISTNVKHACYTLASKQNCHQKMWTWQSFA